jgi:hypothetical protein
MIADGMDGAGMAGDGQAEAGLAGEGIRQAVPNTKRCPLKARLNDDGEAGGVLLRQPLPIS